MKKYHNCWMCGKPATKALMDRHTFTEYETDKAEHIRHEMSVARQYCDECYEKHIAFIKQSEQEYGVLKKRLMLERALKSLDSQYVNMYDMKDTIKQMEEYVEEHPEKFDSSHEMIAAIMLVSAGIKSKMQHKIDKYLVDFYIPSLKIVLEIDGYLHKHKMYYDNERDITIRSLLGKDWEVVRIPTKYLDENAKELVTAMISIKAEKQRIRKTHNGVLPQWYSKRNAAVKRVGNREEYIVDR